MGKNVGEIELNTRCEIAVMHQPQFGLHSNGVGLEVWLQWAGRGAREWFSVADVEQFLISAKIRDVSRLEGQPVITEIKGTRITLRPYTLPILL